MESVWVLTYTTFISRLHDVSSRTQAREQREPIINGLRGALNAARAAVMSCSAEMCFRKVLHQVRRKPCLRRRAWRDLRVIEDLQPLALLKRKIRRRP